MMGGLDCIWFLRSDERTHEFVFHVSDNQLSQSVNLILNNVTAEVGTSHHMSGCPT
jgi:hypothetical protein